jgi:hypothetical protein
MKYVALVLIAVGALMFPFAAKKLIMALSDSAGGDLKQAIWLIIIGAILIGAGAFIAKRDDITSQWRTRGKSKRIRL